MASVDLQINRLNSIIERARMSENPIVQEAFRQELVLRQQTKKELDALLAAVQEQLLKRDYDKIKEEILARLQQDKILVEKLNEEMKTLKAGIEVCWSLKTNKMNLAIPGAQNFVQKHFKEMTEGRLPDNYALTLPPSEVTQLGENNTIYGNSKGTFLKTAALTTYSVCTGQNLSEAASKLFSNLWVDNTSMAHVVPIPNNIRNLTAIDERFAQFTYSFTDATTPRGFVYIHSGYAFGAHRNETRYPRGKTFGPEDCSSWISKVKRAVQVLILQQIKYYSIV